MPAEKPEILAATLASVWQHQHTQTYNIKISYT